MNWRLAKIAILLPALALAGCNSGPKTTLKNVPEQLPSSYTLMEKPDQGISIGAPPGWAMLGAKQPKVEPIPGADPSNTNDQSMEKLMNSDMMSPAAIKERVEKLEAKGIYIYAINTSVRRVVGEKETHYSVKKETVGGNAQLQDVSDKIAKEVNGGMKPEPVELPIGKALMVHGKQTLVDGGEITTVVYGLVNGGDEYIVTFVTEEVGNDLEKMAAEVMPTLRITK